MTIEKYNEVVMDKRYLSYLLRLWETDDDGDLIWRASLETPGSRERLGFANLNDLFDFLRDQTASPSSENSQARSPDEEQERG